MGSRMKAVGRVRWRRLHRQLHMHRHRRLLRQLHQHLRRRKSKRADVPFWMTLRVGRQLEWEMGADGGLRADHSLKQGAPGGIPPNIQKLPRIP